MDDLIGFLIMAVIAGLVWLANKVKESKAGQASPPIISREDLPERTRQMLYGGDVPVAKPKQGQPLHPQTQRTQPAAVPAQRTAPPQAPRQLPPLSPRRPVVAGGRTDASAPRPTARTPSLEEMSPKQLQALREKQAAAQRAAQALAGEELSPHELQALRERQEAAVHRAAQESPDDELSPRELQELRRLQANLAARGHTTEEMSSHELQALHEQHVRAEQQRRLAEQLRRQEEHAKRQAAPPKAAHEQPRPALHRLGWMGDMREVRRGIVLAEILGPPKAMQ